MIPTMLVGVVRDGDCFAVRNWGERFNDWIGPTPNVGEYPAKVLRRGFVTPKEAWDWILTRKWSWATVLQDDWQGNPEVLLVYDDRYCG